MCSLLNLESRTPPNLCPERERQRPIAYFFLSNPVVLWGRKRGQQGIIEEGVAKTNSRVLAHVALAV